MRCESLRLFGSAHDSFWHVKGHAPAYQIEGLGFWALSRYNDVDFVLKNPNLFSSSTFLANMIGDLNPVPEAPSLVSCDPPDHTRLRKLVNKAFTPRIIRSLEPRIREVAQELVSQIAGKSEFDFVYDLSSPLPVIVIAEMLGVKPEDRADFKRWSDDIVLATNRMFTAEDEKRIRESIPEFRAYFQDVIAARRKDPREDLTTALVQAEEEDQKLNESANRAERNFLTLNALTLRVIRKAVSRSVTGFTIAWARSWLGSKPRSHLKNCLRSSRHSRGPTPQSLEWSL